MATARRVVIVGTAGVGGVLARRLVAAGRSVLLVGRDADRLRAQVAEFGATRAGMAVCDVADDDALEALGKELARAGDVSGLVFAAGSIPLAPLKALTPRAMLDAFRVNTLAPAQLLKHLAPSLAAGGAAAPGAAVFFSSVAAQAGFPNHVAIAVAKAGVEGLVRAAAAELAPGVRVNGIAPSLTDTPLASRMTASAAMRTALSAAHPLGRLGTADDLAAAAAFLLDGAQSGWITGAWRGARRVMTAERAESGCERCGVESPSRDAAAPTAIHRPEIGSIATAPTRPPSARRPSARRGRRAVHAAAQKLKNLLAAVQRQTGLALVPVEFPRGDR